MPRFVREINIVEPDIAAQQSIGAGSLFLWRAGEGCHTACPVPGEHARTRIRYCHICHVTVNFHAFRHAPRPVIGMVHCLCDRAVFSNMRLDKRYIAGIGFRLLIQQAEYT